MPTLAFSNVATTPSGGTLTSASFTPQTGDIILVKIITEASTTSYQTPTGGGWTYTNRVTDTTNCWCGMWTAPVTTGGTAQTVSSTVLGGTGHASMCVEVWRNAKLAASPATVDARGTGAPSTPLTTVAAGSVVSWADGDFAAVSPAGHTYNQTSGTVTEVGIDDQSTTFYVAYYAYQTAATAGSQTLGLTAPTGQTWTVFGIEIQDAGAGPSWRQQFSRQRPGRNRRRQTLANFIGTITTQQGQATLAASVDIAAPAVVQQEEAGTSLTAAVAITAPAVQLAPATLLPAVTVNAPPSTLLAPATLTAATSISTTAVQQAIATLAAVAAITDTATLLAPAALAAGFTVSDSGIILAPATVAAAFTLTGNVTELAIATLAAQTSVTGTVVQRAIASLAAAMAVSTSGSAAGAAALGAQAALVVVSGEAAPAVLAALAVLTAPAVQQATAVLNALAVLNAPPSGASSPAVLQAQAVLQAAGIMIPLAVISGMRAGEPHSAWETGEPHAAWAAGEPHLSWAAAGPHSDRYAAGEPHPAWLTGEPHG